MAERKVGIFGGTFDPPHRAHLATARCAMRWLELDEVLFVVAGDPWQKTGTVVAPAADRLAMTQLAVEGDPGFSASDVEVRRHGPSYTVDTLRELAAARPADELFLIVGEDAAAGLAGWRRPREILELAALAVVGRPGASRGDLPDSAVVLPGAFELSSTEIRRRLRLRRSVDTFVGGAVAAYIAEHCLYGERSLARPA